jgi:Na+/proline symporter
MHYLNYHVDYFVVGFFLLITLVVGLRAGGGVKDLRTYAIGHRKFGTAALVLTFLATEVGGQGAINLAGEIGTIGIIVMVTFLSISLSHIVQALWIAPKMVHFKQCMTMGDVMGTLYGRPTQVITGFFSFVIAICCAGAEVIILGVVSESLLGIDARLGILLGGLALTIYVVRGGMKSVTATDVLQFLVLFVLLPVLAATALEQAGGIKAVLTHIPPAQCALWHHPKFSYYSVLFLFIAVFNVEVIDPALIQRMLMAKSTAQLRQMFLTLAGLFTVLFLLFMLLGTTGHQLYPTLSAAEIIPHMIQTLLPVGLRGLMMAGIIAVVMASADSYLHAAGLTLVHDVLQPICAYRAVKINEMHWVRYTTLLAGLFIIGLGLMHSEDLYDLIFTHLEFAAPLLVFPFFAGVLGLKPAPRAFYASAVVTLTTFVVGKLWLPEAVSHFLPIVCVVASGIVFFGVHFVLHGGFVVVKRGTQEAGEQLWQPRRQDLITYLGSACLLPSVSSNIHSSR